MRLGAGWQVQGAQVTALSTMGTLEIFHNKGGKGTKGRDGEGRAREGRKQRKDRKSENMRPGKPYGPTRPLASGCSPAVHVQPHLDTQRTGKHTHSVLVLADVCNGWSRQMLEQTDATSVSKCDHLPSLASLTSGPARIGDPSISLSSAIN